MNVSQIDREDLKPVLDMLFYESENRIYVEYAEIINGKIRAYKPVSYEGLQSLFETIKKKSDVKKKRKVLSFNGFIPRNVLAFNPNSLSANISWFCEGKIREFHLLKKEGLLYYPHLVFTLFNKNLYVHAVKTKELTNTTAIYKAPFPNIYNDGKMCFGNIKKKEFMYGTYEQLMERLEDAFFKSIFTNELMGGNVTKMNNRKLLEGLMGLKKTGLKKFPDKELLPANKILQDVLH